MGLLKYPVLLAGILYLSGCSAPSVTVEIANPLDADRQGEMVEIALDDIKGVVGDVFTVYNADGNAVQSQVTYDNKVIFPVEVASNGKSVYVIKQGQDEVEFEAPKVYGRLFPERKDDMAWENDKAAYRAYGPALQKSGERAFGYDVWTKCVDTLILEQRFHDALVNKISFHVDHGKGMDDYTVGPTLGGGTAALLDSLGQIVYPYCFADYKVLDNGPLRFTVALDYNPLVVDNDTAVIEHRIISLDKGSYLNRTVVSYSGLSKNADVAAGIVVHKQNPEGFAIDNDRHIMAYADSTEHPAAGNGVIYIGTVVPGRDSKADYVPLETEAGSAIGHLLAISPYEPGSDYTYYWGSGWSKGDMPSFTEWQNYLTGFSARANAPLQVTVK